MTKCLCEKWSTAETTSGKIYIRDGMPSCFDKVAFLCLNRKILAEIRFCPFCGKRIAGSYDLEGNLNEFDGSIAYKESKVELIEYK